MTDTNPDWLAERFEDNRAHLRAVAFRMLGSLSEADDAVQEAWLRLSRSDTGEVENLGGWLTTVVSRVCLDMLRSRESRREQSLDDEGTGPIVSRGPGSNPEQEAQLADSVGAALLVVLETLTPAERIAFVLHDLFDLSFEEIAPIVARSPMAARQLASRARRRVRGASVSGDADRDRHRQIVDAFLAAARGGDFARLLSLLDPEVALRADATAIAVGATPEVVGAKAVADTFAGRARVAKLATIDGEIGAVWAPGGRPRVVFAFRIDGDRIVGIDIIADAERLEQMELEIIDT
ncbi:MAG TPA: sigma-70 family RNA polymerase sigma factor [Gemmatimonadaceae bacterium]